MSSFEFNKEAKPRIRHYLKDQLWFRTLPSKLDLPKALEFLESLKSEEDEYEKGDRERVLIQIFKAAVAQNKLELSRSCLTTYGLTAELIMRFHREGAASIFQLAMERKEASVELIDFLSDECHLGRMLHLLDADNRSALHTAAKGGNFIRLLCFGRFPPKRPGRILRL